MGLDKRFGWSSVPLAYVLAADAVVLCGYALALWIFKVNRYAQSTVRVEKGQKVISSGPYSVVRHPMYLGGVLFFIATPIALGSYAALPLFILTIPILVYRTINEEKVLNKELEGYKEYCKKVKYRLVPGIW
jgi:protein-S-isoprenylcysteine O-methyltransferase Ste14